jgi:hypothetical protein
MHLIVFTGINSQVSKAKHEESNISNENKDNSQTKEDESNQLSNEHKTESTGDSTRVPTVGNVVIPLQETVVQQQNTVTPQVTQAVHTGYLDNSLNTISTQADNINDNTLLIELNNSTQ